MFQKGLLHVASSLSVMLAFASASAQAQLNPVGVNLLQNPGHEHPGVYFAGRGEINVSWGWVPFWEEPPAGADPRDPYYRTPEFRPVFAHEYPNRVKSGGGSNRWFNFFALNRKAGVMQYVGNLPIGAPIRFTTYAQLWSSQADHYNPALADRNDGDMKIRVCIDQDGGPRNMEDPELVCSPWAQPNNRWEQLVVDGVAKNDVVNVLIWSTASLPVQHNDAYVDESCFEILPAPNAPGICKGAGLVPTGPNVLPLPPDYVTRRTTAEEQRRQRTDIPDALPKLQTGIQPPSGDAPAVTVNARTVLNVRARPQEAAAVLARVRRGEVLPVLGRSADNQWYLVQLGNQRGWVAARLVLPNKAARESQVVTPTIDSAGGAPSALQPPAGDQPALTVNARERLNIRSAPSEAATVIAAANRGEQLAVVGRSRDGNWYQVRKGDQTGWVVARLTLPNAAARNAPVVAAP
ncbi:MAG: SH3 domain-containing protein [Anaerolineae bacterium]|nr:SH3 domain-containing protein [Anaerolineae bacterium]